MLPGRRESLLTYCTLGWIGAICFEQQHGVPERRDRAGSKKRGAQRSAVLIPPLQLLMFQAAARRHVDRYARIRVCPSFAPTSSARLAALLEPLLLGPGLDNLSPPNETKISYAA